MNEYSIGATSVAWKICERLNENRRENDEFDISIGRDYIKIGRRFKDEFSLYCADGFLDIWDGTFYSSKSFTRMNKKSPIKYNFENIVSFLKQLSNKKSYDKEN